MSTPTYYPYLGSGKTYARIAGADAGLIEIGNASSLVIEVKDNKQHLKDYTKPGGGVYASVARIDTATVKMKLFDLNPANVSRALFGGSNLIAAAAVVDEPVTAYLGALAPLAHPSPSAVVVTNTAGSTTYAENTDYEVRPGGLYIMDGGAITAGQALKVDYSYAAYSNVQALITGAVTLELHFEGLNEANSGKPVILDVYRVQLSPTKALELLGDKFAELDVEGEVLKDPTKTGVGVSQYFSVKLC
jgi:hypothetical protein